MSLVRSFVRNLASSLGRGPKKATPAATKKGKGKALTESNTTGDPEANHIFNIFAGVPDLKISGEEMYPKWLWSLAEPAKTYAQLSSTFIYGNDIESATEYDYRRFLRQHRKLVIKVNNSRLQKSKKPVESKIRIP